MSYLVLARKYRPKTFADVVGQNHVVTPLANALKTDRIAHAYLFSGARGVGKTTTARLLAMALNCGAEPGLRPCGECETCREIISGHAVDVFEVDGASNRGINEIRDLRETIKYLPSKGRYKIYIIDEVHMLTKEAFNALLKTLEEPPEHVVFIFATTEAHKVLPTILSRCQRYDFKRINLEDIVGRLQEIARLEDIKVSDAALRLLARESEGGLRDALSLFDQVIAFSGLEISDDNLNEALGLIDRTLVFRLTEALLSGDPGAGLDLLDQVYSFGHDIKDFATQILAYFRALVVVKVAPQPEKILDLLDSEYEEIKNLAQKASLETLNFQFNAWLDVQTQLLRSPHPRLVLEALIVKLAQVEPIRPLAELVARLEALLSSGTDGQGSVPGGSSSPPPSRFSNPSVDTGPGPRMKSAFPQDQGGLESNQGVNEVGAIERTWEEPPRTENEQETPAPEYQTGPDSFAGTTRSVQPDDSDGSEALAPADSAPPQPGASWQDFVDRYKPGNLLLFSFLDQGVVSCFSREEVRVAFGRPGAIDVVDRDKFLTLLGKFFGSRPSLSLSVDESSMMAAEEKARGREEAKAKAREDILAHPLIQEAQRLFSCDHVEVIPDIEA